MKKCASATLLLCLCLTVHTAVAQGFENDPAVVFLDVAVYSGTGDLLSLAGPYLWAAQNWTMGNVPPGHNLRMELTLSDSDGNALYAGSVDGLTLVVPPPPPPPGPFPPPPPPPPVPLTLFPVPEGIFVAGEAGSFVVVLEPLMPPVIEVAVDIRPWSTRNPFNMRSRGVLPLVIMGASDFDVSQIDVASLTVGGVDPRWYKICDVAGDVADERPMGDGYLDLMLFVKSHELAAVLGDPEHRSVLDIEVVGELLDGTMLVGSDIITVLNRKVKKPRTPKLRKHHLKKSGR